jgi:hypothetical protein
MAECYVYYKPREAFRQAGTALVRLTRGLVRGTMPELLAGLVLAFPALAGVVVLARRDPDACVWLRSLSRVVAVVIPFSLIPGIAFYPALTTVACFYLLTGAIVTLLLVRLAVKFPVRRF